MRWRKAEDKAGRVGDKAEDKADRVGDRSESVLDKTKDKARDANNEIREKCNDVKHRAERANVRQDVKSVQQALQAKGHNAGPIDGRMGPRTSAALRDYQKAEGLQVTGRLDDATREKLGVDRSAGASPATDPAVKPPAKRAQNP